MAAAPGPTDIEDRRAGADSSIHIDRPGKHYGAAKVFRDVTIDVGEPSSSRRSADWDISSSITRYCGAFVGIARLAGSGVGFELLVT